MWDNFSQDRVDVRLDEECGPYIMIEPANIARTEALLQRHGISFKLEEGPNPCVGTPEAAVIEFGRDVDVDKIQRVLDSVP